MRRRVITIHKAVKAHEAAMLLGLLTEMYGEHDVEMHPTKENGLVLTVASWHGRIAR